MPQILIVEKNGSIKELNVKAYQESELYKKAGLKNPEGFIMHTSWSAEINGTKYTVQLYGKTEGKANQENKFEFPPPVDSVLFFGNCVLVNVVDNVVKDLREKEWEQIYEFLYGGFEDIEEEDSEDEEDSDDDLPKTKEGYVKDDFIVDDDESEESVESEEEEDEDSEEEYIKKSKKSKKKPILAKKTPKVSSKKKDTEIPENIFIKTSQPELTQNYLDCTSELDFEPYV